MKTEQKPLVILPLEILMEEHRMIEFMLQGLQALTERSEPFDAELAQNALEFIRAFADKHHHGKEEKLLFALMHERGFSLSSGPLAVMYSDHEAGRALVREMSEALGNKNLSRFAERAREFVGLLGAHIQKEDRILYPMAEKFLTGADMKALAQAFAEFEQEAEKTGVQARALEIANQIGALASGCDPDRELGCEGCSHCG